MVDIKSDPMRTEAFHRFLAAGTSTDMFCRFVLRTATDYQQITNVAALIAKEVGKILPAQSAEFEDVLKRIPRPMDELSLCQQAFGEMVLCRAVDNFLTYISDLLTLIYKEQPILLKRADSDDANDKQIPINEVLKYSTMEELIHSLVERKVKSLSYKGLKKLDEYVTKQVGVGLFANKDIGEWAILLVEMRNVITHNRGVINTTFVNNIRVEFRSHYAINNKLMLTLGNLQLLQASPLEMAFDLDKRACQKYKLPVEDVTNYPGVVSPPPEPPATSE